MPNKLHEIERTSLPLVIRRSEMRCDGTTVCVRACSLDIELLFLVGGFAESAMLQADIKQQFGQRVRIAIPQDASLAILKGTIYCRSSL